MRRFEDRHCHGVPLKGWQSAGRAVGRSSKRCTSQLAARVHGADSEVAAGGCRPAPLYNRQAGRIWPAAFSVRGAIPHRRYPQSTAGARERPVHAMCAGVSRSGAMPEPTVTVRMKESVEKAVARESEPPPLPACALILATTMDQTLTSPSGSACTEQAQRGTPRIAIVSSRWHEDIVNSAIGAALAELERHGIAANRVHQSKVRAPLKFPCGRSNSFAAASMTRSSPAGSWSTGASTGTSS